MVAFMAVMVEEVAAKAVAEAEGYTLHLSTLSHANATGYMGVNFNNASSRYRAVYNDKSIGHHVGYFADPIEAAHAYNLVALHLLEEAARLHELGGGDPVAAAIRWKAVKSTRCEQLFRCPWWARTITTAALVATRRRHQIFQNRSKNRYKMEPKCH